MINLREINKFLRIEQGEYLELPRRERRVVRLELNTAEPCQLKLQTGPREQDMRFLANVVGRETVEFVAEGPVTIWPDSDGEVWVWTSEVESSAVVVADAATFTKIATRKARNPELERVALKMQQNMERRFQMLAGDVERMARENEQLRAASKPKPEAKAKEAKPNGDAAGAVREAGGGAPAGDAGKAGGPGKKEGGEADDGDNAS